MSDTSTAPRWWHCATHGPAKANDWGCPECVREMRGELQELRTALRTVAHAHAWREFGECRAYGDLPMLRPSEVDAVARRALGMPAVPTKEQQA